MIKIIKLYYSVWFILLITGCSGGKQSNPLINKIDSLEEQLSQKSDSILYLRNQIEEYKSSPEQICKDLDTLFLSKNVAKLLYIKNRLKQYHPTTSQIQVIDSMLDAIQKAQTAEKEASRAEELLSLNKLRKKYDDVSGILWFYNPYFTHYDNVNRTSIYMGKSSVGVWLRLKMSYEGEEWLFFKTAYLSFDGKTLQIPFDEYKEKESDNGYGGRVWEWIDVKVTPEIESFIGAMSKSKNAKMRFVGKYSYTRNLTYQELKGLSDVLTAYHKLLTKE